MDEKKVNFAVGIRFWNRLGSAFCARNIRESAGIGAGVWRISLLLTKILVTRMGFEPMNAAVKGQCVKPLHQLAIFNGAPTRT